MTTALRLLLLALFLLAVFALWAYTTRPAAAGAVLCDPDVRPRPAASFWCVPPGASVRVTGGEWGLSEAEGAGVAVLWAQGWYDYVEIDGQTVAGEHRVYLPWVVGRGQ